MKIRALLADPPLLLGSAVIARKTSSVVVYWNSIDNDRNSLRQRLESPLTRSSNRAKLR